MRRQEKKTPAPAGLEGLLSRLGGVRQTGADKWIARCAAHEDRTPSLSVRDAGDRILIYCHAGCHAEDILTAVGLRWRDLYRDPWKASYAAALAVGGRNVERLPKPDPLEHERLILKLAKADIARGAQMSLEDRARVELAVERLEGMR